MNRHLLPVALIAFISFVIYANTLKNGFVYDDCDTIVNNAFIKDFNNIPQLFDRNYFTLSDEMSYRPVVTFTYFLDYALYGLQPWGFHLTNIFLHFKKAVKIEPNNPILQSNIESAYMQKKAGTVRP